MNYKYTSLDGDFSLVDPELTSYLYFPIANESGVMSSVTPTLAGDSKMGQNLFFMSPVSAENLHNEKSSRNIWAKINNKEVISLNGKSAVAQAQLFSNDPSNPKDATQLEAGFMYHKITRYSKYLKSMITNFVPATNETVEIMHVDIENTFESEINIQIVTAIPIYARSADNIRDHRHVTSLLNRIYNSKNGIMVQPTMTFDERGHQLNSKVYGVFGNGPIGFYPTIEDFIGEGGNLENPKALYEIPLNPAKIVSEEHFGYEALGGLCFEEIILQPGQKVSYNIVMAYGDDIDLLEQSIEKFLETDYVLNSLEYTKKYWREKVNVSYHTSLTNFDCWMKWVSFQPMLRRIYGCSFLPHHDYGKGGRGWRDLWQDCLALLIMNPENVKSMLIDNFAGVRIDGTNATIIGQKQGEFIADRNNITRVWMDHGVWPFLTLDLYIQHTGDLEILLEKNTYFQDLQICRGEVKNSAWKVEDGQKLTTSFGTVYEGTILEHLLVQNLTAFYDVGHHNHIRIRGADWNDALDMAEKNGESVAFTSMYAYNLEKLADLIDKLEKKGIREIELFQEIESLIDMDLDVDNHENIGSKKEVLSNYFKNCSHKLSGVVVKLTNGNISRSLRQKGQWIKEHIRKEEWIEKTEELGWFNGYYDNNKRKLENENHMMLTSQVFMIMSGTASDAQVGKIIKAADKYLYDENVGGYKLNTNFKEIKMDMGRMYGFAYGHKENGAVFAHMAIMYAYSLYSRRYSMAGYKVIESLFSHCDNFSVSKILPGIPEYIDAKGRGMYHYLTGSASWLLVTVINKMFGVSGEYGDLSFDPQLLRKQFDKNNVASISMMFAGKKIKVIYTNIYNKEVHEYKVNSLILEGEIYFHNIPRKVIEKLKDDRDYIIDVILE
ncbi:MAG: cellobiose phosphorylase [Candidatus Epulonipiscioides saccharophilum]|nr:MAG: cellobiose phosphorylase [Epulopiscium sp. AS2M-Bin001]